MFIVLILMKMLLNIENKENWIKHIIVSKPLSLNLSAIDIPIKGNVNDNIEMINEK